MCSLKTASIALYQSAGVAACVLRGLGGGVQHGAAEGGGARGAGAAVRGQGGAPLQDRAAPLPAVPQVTTLTTQSRLSTHPSVCYSLGIEGGPGKAYEECEMVTKNICESVPVTKDITAEVETCIQTPKEVGCM